MSGSRSLFEKIVLFILFIISLPFTLSLFILFVLIYIIILPIEYPFYKRTPYRINLHEKYYLFVTFNKTFKIFNKFANNGKLVNDGKLNYYELDGQKLILNNYNYSENDNSYILVKKSSVEKEFYQKYKNNELYLFY